MSVDPNTLLYIISAYGSMSWAQYIEAVDFLTRSCSGGLWDSRNISGRNGLLQCFQALGHCDAPYERGGTVINVTPPTLSRLPRAGLPIAVLTGARSSRTRTWITEAAQKRKGTVQLIVERRPGLHGLLPDTFFIEAEAESTMLEFCEDLNILYTEIPPAWTLMNWCGTLTEYEETLDYRISQNLNWTRFDFNANSLAFIRTASDSLPRYSRYRNPITGLPKHVFYRDDLGAEVDLHWGRYLFLNSNGITVTAYDEKRFRLCVLVKVPLPTIVARTLCLCSGKSPVYRLQECLVQDLEYQDWLMFEDVAPQIAMAALSKVGQSPERVEIK